MKLGRHQCLQIFQFKNSLHTLLSASQVRKTHQDPILTLNGSPIPVVEETKFLGIIFDRKLSFIPHIRHLKREVHKGSEPITYR